MIDKENKEDFKFEGKVKIYEKDENGDYTKLIKTSKNLWVDDGKELVLDFLWGLKSWWNPKDSYSGGDSGWNTNRYVGFGDCMFSNKSFERASGIKGVPSGEEYDYKVSNTYLVSPEDSFLSNEVGNRIKTSITRRDQAVEITATIDVPGDLPVNTEIREFAMFLDSTGPIRDPSLDENSKKYTMICRSALYGTGYYNQYGACDPDDTGAELCYYDDPYIATDDVQLVWIFGEL
ncbi:MAG: hypothetical protein ACTSQY_00165 [Candidatus Odinarchaeia archaeon]|nr:MAG: hypothetical protein [Lokiarchaeota virus Fenrir Meg22_1012]URC17212.1 MAG: hypothetical protein [Lokiarchaeota virus Fenrir Meg22_1214]